MDIKVRDSNGAVLAEGDSVTLIKDLNLKGSSTVLKRGTMIRGIHHCGEAAVRYRGPPAYSSSGFFPPIVFSFANTASTLRSSRCFSLGSYSGSLRVVSEAGSRVAPP